MKNNDCKIVIDLIPLVKDGIASDESCQLVEEHIKNCKECKKEYELTNASEQKIETSERDNRTVSIIKRNMNVVRVLFFLIIIGILLSTSTTNNIFNNAIIMPCIGGISYILLKKKSYFVPIFVFIADTIINIIYNFEDTGATIVSYSVYGFIYMTLILIGIVIIELLNYGFKPMKIINESKEK